MPWTPEGTQVLRNWTRETALRLLYPSYFSNFQEWCRKQLLVHPGSSRKGWGIKWGGKRVKIGLHYTWPLGSMQLPKKPYEMSFRAACWWGKWEQLLAPAPHFPRGVNSSELLVLHVRVPGRSLGSPHCHLHRTALWRVEDMESAIR